MTSSLVVISGVLLCFRHTCACLQLSHPPPPPLPHSQAFHTWIDRTIREAARHVGLDKVVSSKHLLSVTSVAECRLIKANTANRKDVLKQAGERIFRAGKPGEEKKPRRNPGRQMDSFTSWLLLLRPSEHIFRSLVLIEAVAQWKMEEWWK